MISAVVLTKNEEKNIVKCLASIEWCDEILVIDDESIDKTVDLAKKTKAHVYVHPKNDDFSSQRNFGLEKAKGEWVLFVDADERVSSALWYEIMQYINASIKDYYGFYIKRNDNLFGKVLEHGETGNVSLLRLAKKGAGTWSGSVHEVWNVKGNTMQLKNYLEHYPHKTVEEFLKDINYYTDIKALELYRDKIKVFWPTIIFLPFGKFILNYFIKRGFMDEVPGLVLALMMSFHSFLVRAKLWLLWQKDNKA